MNRRKWNNEEVEFLLNNYRNKNVKEISSILNRSEQSIHCKLNTMGLNFGRYKTISEEDRQFLINNYDNFLNKELAEKLGITLNTLKTLAKELGLKKSKNYNEVIYSEEDIKIILENKNLSATEILKFLPDKKYNTLLPKMKELGVWDSENKLIRLGVTVTKIKDGKLKCSKCKIEKEYIEDNFDTINNLSQCRECKKIYSFISHYKRNYGLDLDWDLLLDTYSPEQWVEFYLEKRINIYPIGYLNKEVLKLMIRYIVFKKLGLNYKNDILKINRSFLEPFNLISGINTYFNGWFETINYCFPEYNIKPFELPNMPANYLSDIENADRFMEYELKKFMENQSLDNLSFKLSSYFNQSNLSKIKKNSLNSVIMIHKHYRNFYEWISKLRPEWNLNEKDFKYCISNIDNSLFDSLEERDVYDFILNKNINIESVGRRRKGNCYYNKNYNESYYPDFKIYVNDDLKCIIEYFGLYREVPNTKISKTYKAKADRKVEYFSSLPDVKFLAIYPEDLKNNFKGLSIKLEKLISEIK